MHCPPSHKCNIWSYPCPCLSYVSCLLFQDLLHPDLLPSPPPLSLFSSPHYPTSSNYSSQHVPTITRPLLPHNTSIHPATGSPNTHGLPRTSSDILDPNYQIYSQLQFPLTSNKGSMKKKKVEPDLESAGPNHTSSSSLSSSPSHRETEYYEQDVKVWAVEYVPDVFSIRKKTVKVWYSCVFKRMAEIS